MHRSQQTFFWHDYETTGTDKARDRPSQFAGIRTTLDLEEVEDPIEVFCKPCVDILPMPEAVLLTGITPQQCEERGVSEAEFAREVLRQLGRPGTCGVGYNSLKFDDEVTRNVLYRNFHDPYAREWQNNNSRWDLLDVVRAFYLFSPEGINWPMHENGVVSFRLEDLAKANNLEQERAHDAVSDVRATIALARLLRDANPELFNHCFELRLKKNVQQMVDCKQGIPLLHVAGFYENCLSAILPLCFDPQSPNTLIALNLSGDLGSLASATPEQLAQALFYQESEEARAEAAAAKLPLAKIAINRCPMLFPLSQIRPHMQATFGARAQKWSENWRAGKSIEGFAVRLAQACALRPPMPAAPDPELALYGAFPSPADKSRCAEVVEKSPAKLGGITFEEARFNELLFRYRARNWPEHLTAEEAQKWEEFCRQRLLESTVLTKMTLPDYRAHLEKLRVDPAYSGREGLFASLFEWLEKVEQRFSPSAAPMRP